MGKPDSLDSRPKISASERSGKLSGINVRPNLLQRECPLDAENQRILIRETAHHINNPLSSLRIELWYLELQSSLQPLLQPLQALSENINKRIEQIVEKAKPGSNHPMPFDDLVCQLRVMEIDVVSLQVAFQVTMSRIELQDPEVLDSLDNIDASIFHLRRRTQEAIVRFESSNPAEEFFLIPTEANIATADALRHAGWEQPVQRLSEKRPIILNARDPLSVVFENIILNARKYGGELQIITDVQDRQFIIRFEDDGPGFAGDPSAMFGIFVQGQKQPSSGFGIGMSACKRLVDKMKGEIKAENMIDEEGAVRGARVILRFPVVEEVSG